VLKSLTPARHTTAFFDDRVEAIDYEADCDAVAITVETYTAQRAYQIAERFRARGRLVIMGGYHATLAPDDVAPHADVVITGNAEGIWAEVLAAVEDGSFKPRYEGAACLAYRLPDRSIYEDKMRKYLPISLVETGRGCRHDCEFCCITRYYGRRYYHRPVADIVAEIESCRHRLFFFVDDSIFSDHAFARELFCEVAKLNIVWTTQITLDIARDEELLRLMRRSGCELVLIGFESIDPGNLRQMNKEWSARLGQRDELVERIHRAGINIYASFVFGFDYDSEESFQRVFEFSRRHRFFVVAYNHLLAFPGTGTYEELSAQGRLLHERWWMQPGYRYGDISFVPRLLSPERLARLCGAYKARFFTFFSIFRRGAALWRRTRSPFIHLAFWVQNILFHFEVDKRIGIPVGSNLDEDVK
jgi:radical SAM superfamily enzyme YgiQ (UPF0313 family)